MIERSSPPSAARRRRLPRLTPGTLHAITVPSVRALLLAAMALNAVTAQYTRVCCAVCGAHGLWGYVVTFTWDFLDLAPVHVCPSCLARWEHKARRLRTLKCKSWDLVHGRGSRRSPDLRCGYVSLELTPYVGASLMRTLWSIEGVNLDRRVSKGLVVLWLQSRGEIKTHQRRQSAGR